MARLNLSEVNLAAAKAHFEASHQHPINRALHHLVNVIAIVGVVWLLIDWRVSVVCLVLTQILAIGGHYVFEKNHPAFFRYPGIVIVASFWWSFENGFGFRDRKIVRRPRTQLAKNR